MVSALGLESYLVSTRYPVRSSLACETTPNLLVMSMEHPRPWGATVARSNTQAVSVVTSIVGNAEERGELDLAVRRAMADLAGARSRGGAPDDPIRARLPALLLGASAQLCEQYRRDGVEPTHRACVSAALVYCRDTTTIVGVGRHVTVHRLRGRQVARVSPQSAACDEQEASMMGMTARPELYEYDEDAAPGDVFVLGGEGVRGVLEALTAAPRFEDGLRACFARAQEPVLIGRVSPR